MRARYAAQAVWDEGDDAVGSSDQREKEKRKKIEQERVYVRERDQASEGIECPWGAALVAACAGGWAGACWWAVARVAGLAGLAPGLGVFFFK